MALINSSSYKVYAMDLYVKPVFRIRSQQIRMFLGLLDPDPGPLVRGMDPDPALDQDPDPSIIMQKW